MSAMPYTDSVNVLPMGTKPAHGFVAITPEIAARWLTGNTVNRKLRTRAVNDYARRMELGLWTVSADAICFTADGKLLNGQHRLSAVVKTGLTITMGVLRNVPESAMTNMDQGAKRTAGDVLGFAGETRGQLLAATLKFLIIWQDGRLYQNTQNQSVSPAEMALFLDEHPSVREAVRLGDHYHPSIAANPTALAACIWKCMQVDAPATVEFFDALSQRAGLPAGSPILALDSRLRQLQKNRQKVVNREMVGLFVKAWNHWGAGHLIRSVSLPSGNDRIAVVTRKRGK